MVLYKSVYQPAEAEYTVQKSRFIAHVTPIESYEEGQAFVTEIKQKYKDATHNVPAIISGFKQEMQWASDDGEPSGTSGLPMLKMVADEGLTNLAIVVTRYFGGIKLGTGGLARAYTTAAKSGIEACGICEVVESVSLQYEFDYSYLAKLQNLAGNGRFDIDNLVYTDKVSAELNCMSEERDYVVGIMSDLTLGQGKLVFEMRKTLRRRI